MGLFDNIIKKTVRSNLYNKPTTKGICIGVPEAEAEATTAPFKLDELFSDYLNIFSQLNDERFIVLGRKGCGKTAIGEMILNYAIKNPNQFCKFIKKGDIDIEYIAQIGKTEGYDLKDSLLLKWVILTQLLKLMTENESLNSINGFDYLKQFIKQNTGFIDINKNQISHIIKTSGITVNAEQLLKYLAISGNKQIEIQEEKPVFYKLIPDLEKAVLNIMKNDTDNNYILIFDDLDIDFKATKEEDVNTMADLLRSARDFNNDFFGRNGLGSKIFILMRSDMAKSLIYKADMGKILSSYAIHLNWYKVESGQNPEEASLLRKFINRRIQLNFEKKGYVVKHLDPWSSFVNERDFWDSKTGFKYIIDNTFFRPRDLIMFFRGIESEDYEIPLSKDTIQKKLLPKYANNMVTEIKGELGIKYSTAEIDSILFALKKFNRKKGFSYVEIKEELSHLGIKEKGDTVIETLFDYSLIGNKYSEDNLVFKCREEKDQEIKINKNTKLVLCYLLQSFFYKEKY